VCMCVSACFSVCVCVSVCGVCVYQCVCLDGVYEQGCLVILEKVRGGGGRVRETDSHRETTEAQMAAEANTNRARPSCKGPISVGVHHAICST